MNINERLIRDYMWFNKLTKEKFCKLCGISYAVLSKILNNQHNFKYSAIFKVAKVMNVKVSQLFIATE